MKLAKDVIKVEFTDAEMCALASSYHALLQLLSAMKNEERTVLCDYCNSVTISVNTVENIVTILDALSESNDIRIETPNEKQFYFPFDTNK